MQLLENQPVTNQAGPPPTTKPSNSSLIEPGCLVNLFTFESFPPTAALTGNLLVAFPTWLLGPQSTHPLVSLCYMKKAAGTLVLSSSETMTLGQAWGWPYKKMYFSQELLLGRGVRHAE